MQLFTKILLEITK